MRRAWRGRGLGLALLRHAFRAFSGVGKAGARLEVDAESQTGATRLYEEAAMTSYQQSDKYEKVLRDGVELAEVT